MFKFIAKKPIVTFKTYNKFGFSPYRYQGFDCPRCHGILNAGPNYQPHYCDKCGQKVDFSGIEYVPEEYLGPQ